ncbi:hypothetical protein GCM10014715_79240 [Streptomyces spiralis]|uniref:Fibronectin type III-like domain-containing protein n=1 Tax=Streptomyces spiralis TaxID=66376 RepID=A0A919E435_9ACTN|nr:hypothetical protein GCM10014715_79240 [Streptomyces spiralis]
MLSGRTNPCGRLPVSVPRGPGAQPATYLGARLAHVSEVSTIDPTPAFGFGHGLSYTEFDWSDLVVAVNEVPTDGAFHLAFTVRNTGGRHGTEAVQLYLDDPVASVVQSVQRLIGYTQVALEPGEAQRVRVRVTVPADLASFTGRDGRRVVEPGELELRLAASSTNPRLTATVTLTGPNATWTTQGASMRSSSKERERIRQTTLDRFRHGRHLPVVAARISLQVRLNCPVGQS